MDQVAARAGAIRRRRHVRLSAAAVAGLLVVSLAAVNLYDPAEGSRRVTVADDTGGPDLTLPSLLPDGVGGPALPGPGSTTTTTTRQGGSGPSTTTTTASPVHQEDACLSGRNSGASDAGVTATGIEVVVQSGVSGQQNVGVRAVVDAVNQGGGICGRRISARYIDSGQPLPAGDTYFAAIPDAGAGAAVPSGVPAVGGDGLVHAEYQPWSWPVGTSAAAQARIMAKHAYDLGARTFGVAYEKQFPYGTEAAASFRDEVKRLTGSDPQASAGLDTAKSSYVAEANQFNSACGTQCDFVLLALARYTASNFLRDAQPGRVGTGGLSMLTGEAFARSCGTPCDGLWVWSPFRPPVGDDANDPAVAAYVNAVKAQRPDADQYDATVERGYVGAKLLMAAIRGAGPGLTRARLRDVLNQMSYAGGLTVPLTWRADHIANDAAAAVSMRTGGGGFAGFRTETGFVMDHRPGSWPS
jgi:ABC-type branched-subunit amino acid transport system substrate-binding protein